LEMDPESHGDLLAAVKDLAGSGNVEGWIEDRLREAEDRGRFGEDRRRRVGDERRRAADRRRAMDNPPPFRGMPEPGGTMVRDRRRAMDAAPAGKSFAESFPSAGKIRHSFSVGR